MKVDSVKSRLKQYGLRNLHDWSPVLNESRSETRTRSAGNLFQRTTDMWENEYW